MERNTYWDNYTKKERYYIEKKWKLREEIQHLKDNITDEDIWQERVEDAKETPDWVVECGREYWDKELQKLEKKLERCEANYWKYKRQ